MENKKRAHDALSFFGGDPETRTQNLFIMSEAL